MLVALVYVVVMLYLRFMAEGHTHTPCFFFNTAEAFSSSTVKAVAVKAHETSSYSYPIGFFLRLEF